MNCLCGNIVCAQFGCIRARQQLQSQCQPQPLIRQSDINAGELEFLRQEILKQNKIIIDLSENLNILENHFKAFIKVHYDNNKRLHIKLEKMNNGFEKLVELIEPIDK